MKSRQFSSVSSLLFLRFCFFASVSWVDSKAWEKVKGWIHSFVLVLFCFSINSFWSFILFPHYSFLSFSPSSSTSLYISLCHLLYFTSSGGSMLCENGNPFRRQHYRLHLLLILSWHVFSFHWTMTWREDSFPFIPRTRNDDMERGLWFVSSLIQVSSKSDWLWCFTDRTFTFHPRS